MEGPRASQHEQHDFSDSDSSVSSVSTPLLPSVGKQSSKSVSPSLPNATQCPSKAFRISWRSNGRPTGAHDSRSAIEEEARDGNSESTSNLLSGPGSQRYVGAWCVPGTRLILTPWAEKQVYYIGDREFQPWQPWVFHWVAFAGLALVLVVLIILSELFIHFSIHAHDGLPVVSRGLASIPVIVLLVVAVTWHLLDLESRKLAPWASMRREPQAASSSILLDYMGPLLPFRLHCAIRHRHWAVAVTSIGLPIVVAATVFSTSIWTAHSTTGFVSAQLATTSTFNASKLDLSSTDQTYLHLFLNARASTTTQAYGPWTDMVYALDSFAPVSPVPPHTPVRGITNGTHADLACQPAAATYAGNLSIADPAASSRIDVRQHQLSVTAAGCVLTHNFTITSGKAVAGMCLRSVTRAPPLRLMQQRSHSDMFSSTRALDLAVQQSLSMEKSAAAPLRISQQ
jgi:hypothetical protein